MGKALVSETNETHKGNV